MIKRTYLYLGGNIYEKNLQKLLLTFFTLITVAIIYQVPVKAERINFQMISDPSVSTNVVTVKWTELTDVPSDREIISYSYDIVDVSTNTYLVRNSKQTSFSKNMGCGYEGYWRLDCNYTFRNTEFDYESESFESEWIYVNTTPETIAKKNFSITYANDKSVWIATIVPKNTNGVQLLVYNGTKCIYNKVSSNGYFDVPISKNKAYRYYVRAYYTNNTNKKTYYGKWSSARHFVNAPFSGKSKSNKKGFSLTLNKVSGVTKYKIYVSTNLKSGYKLSKTLNVGSKSKYTVQITKYVKKQKINYIRVIPEIKGYGKSDLYYGGSIYVKK